MSKYMYMHVGCHELHTCTCIGYVHDPITGVFRLVDTKFANGAELNSCSQNLRPLHLYDSIFCSLEFILHMCKFYWSTNLKTSVCPSIFTGIIMLHDPELYSPEVVHGLGSKE